MSEAGGGAASSGSFWCYRVTKTTTANSLHTSYSQSGNSQQPTLRSVPPVLGLSRKMDPIDMNEPVDVNGTIVS